MTEATRNFEKPEHLAETDWLERSLDDPDLRVFDCAVYNDWNPDPVLGKKFPLVIPQMSLCQQDLVLEDR